MSREIKLPELGENIDAGDVIKIMVGHGDTIVAEQPILEIETDKAALEVPSPIAGKVEKVHVAIGDRAKVGQVILTISDNGAEKKEDKNKPPPRETPRQAKPAPIVNSPDVDLIPAAPSLRRMARERGVDLRGVQGSGPKGRITSHDLMPTHEPRVIQDSAPAELDFAKWGAIEVKPLNTVRRLTALNLARSWSQVPQVTHYDSADVTELDELRSKLTEQLGQGKLKITITAILLKVVAAALKRMPQFNASLDLANNQVIYKKYIHIGVAVDTERGLLVPVIRDVEQKSILELAAELEDVSRRARDKKLPADEMRGATFTISNLGGIGGTNFSPIVNAPEVAILGVSRTQTQPRLMHGFFVPRLLLPLALSYDHRLIDGADAARFVRLLVDLIEQPALMAFDA